ncbi:MAG: hypothetical protein DYG86_15900, partial [Chloroflexi bacterium CFX2]|nr:hypothetical protein [Chloroflexi bacterium CFX2]
SLFDKAIESFHQALEIANDNIQAQVNIALTYMDQKLYDKAVVEFEKTLALDDEDVSARAGLCEAHLALGDLALTKGRERDAALSYQRVLAINAEHTEARGRMADIARQRAEKALTDGRDEEALSAFAEALRYTPEDEALSTRFEEVKKERREKVLSTLLVRAEKELTAKNWDSAIRTLQEGLQLSAEDERFKDRIATAKENQRAAKLESCLVRATQAEQAGKWEAAAAALQEYLSMEADQPQVQGRLEKAHSKLREIELNELRERARSFALSERWDESLTAWDAVLVQDPTDSSARSEREKVEKSRGLATSYAEAQSAFAKKDYDKAIALFKNIVMEDSDYKEATRLLAESVELRRTVRKWWQSRWALGGVAIITLLIGAWLLVRFGLPLFTAQPASPIGSEPAIANPLPASPPSVTLVPTASPTPLPLKWTRLNSGQFLQRDQVNTIAFDPSDPGVIYAGMQNAGIYKSIDGGLSWQPILTGLKDAGIDTIIVDPDDPQTIFASALMSGVYRSTDGGTNWQLTTDVINSWWSSHLVMSPIDSSILYFSTGYNKFFKTVNGGADWERMINECPLSNGVTSMVALPDGELLVGVFDNGLCTSGIYRSAQDATSWSLVRSFASDIPWFGGLAVDSTGGFIYSINESDHAPIVYSSSNGGQDWSEPIRLNCSKIAVQPGDGAIAYCGTEDGAVYQTQNGGKDWEFLGAPNSGPVKAIVFSPNDAQKIFAGGNGLYFSSDGGHNWSGQGNGLGGKFFELSIHPITQAFYIQQVASNTSNNVIYRSNDNGADWQSFKKGCKLNFSADGELHCWYGNSEVSYDDGATWSRGSNRFGGDVAYPNPYKADEFFGAPFDGGIVSSRDGGQTWQEVNAGIKFDNPAFFFAPDQNRIYLIDLRSDWSYTSANGESWTPCNPTSEFDFSITQTRAVIDPRDSAKIYVATQGSGVVVSADACSSWALTNNGLGSLFVNSLTHDSNNPGTIYAGTDDGAYVSYNGGSSWAQITNGLLGATVVYSIVVDKDSNVYAATPYGIFKLEGK